MKIRALTVASLATLSLLTACSNEAEPVAKDPTTPSSSVEATPTEGTGTPEDPTDTTAPTEDPTDESTETPTDPQEPAGEADRFQSTYLALTDLFVSVDASNPDAEPRNAEQANEAAELDESTNLIFADFTVADNESDGSFCLEADNGTYVATTFVGMNGTMLLGDGACSYDTDNAAVVGDLVADKWTTGKSLMGDLKPSGPLTATTPTTPEG